MQQTLACGPGSPELSKSDSDMASKLFTFTGRLQSSGLLQIEDLGSWIAQTWVHEHWSAYADGTVLRLLGRVHSFKNMCVHVQHYFNTNLLAALS